MNNAPIGVLDSGIGGLTVAHAIRTLLPKESIYYFGDTAHLPYGDKSAASVKHYTATIAKYLVSRGCKVVVIACNTASSYAAKAAREAVPEVKVVDVVTPVVQYAQQHLTQKIIGVIGTKGTIGSRIYPRKLNQAVPDAKVKSMATPLLASMVEEGFFNNNISAAVINAYLSSHFISEIDALILACTHYPLIKKEIEAYYKANAAHVEVLDNAHLTALAVQAYLRKTEGLTAGTAPQDHFMVSDFTESFQKSTQIFFGTKISLEEVRIWD